MKTIVSSALAGVMVMVGSAVAADGVGDRREPISLAFEARAELLAEMRGHLANVQALLDALSKGDLPAAEAAARASGLASASEAGNDMSRRLPPAFLALGMSMHRDFDELADAAARRDDAAALIGRLAATMQKCVGCHTAYQVRLLSARTVKP